MVNITLVISTSKHLFLVSSLGWVELRAHINFLGRIYLEESTDQFTLEEGTWVDLFGRISLEEELDLISYMWLHKPALALYIINLCSILKS